MGNYADADALKALKVQGAVLDLSAFSDEELEADIELAEFIIEKYTNTIFYLKTAETNLLDGTGDRVLFVYPKVPYPLVSVTEVLEVDELGQTLWTFETPDDFWYDGYSLQKNWTDRESGRRGASRSGGVTWPKGVRNIKVTGNWGRASVPAPITRATLLLAAEMLKPGSTKLSSSVSVEEKEWEDYRVRYKRDTGKTTVMDSTGLDFVDMLLDCYRVTPAMFLVPPSHAPH